MRGRREPHLHHGDETLATGEDFGIGAELLKKGDGFVQRTGCGIFKATRDHGGPHFTATRSNRRYGLSKQAVSCRWIAETLRPTRPRKCPTAGPPCCI